MTFIFTKWFITRFYDRIMCVSSDPQRVQYQPYNEIVHNKTRIKARCIKARVTKFIVFKCVSNCILYYVQKVSVSALYTTSRFQLFYHFSVICNNKIASKCYRNIIRIKIKLRKTWFYSSPQGGANISNAVYHMTIFDCTKQLYVSIQNSKRHQVLNTIVLLLQLKSESILFNY